MDPWKLIMHSADQLRLLLTATVFHIDATGGIIRRTQGGRQIFLFSIVPNDAENSIICCSGSDFLTERCRVEDVIFWLCTVKTGMLRVGGHKLSSTTHPRLIVIDFSWVLIHATCLIFSGMMLPEYQRKIFAALLNDTPVQFTLITLCSSHMIALFVRTINKQMTAPSHVRETIVRFLSQIMLAKTLKEAGSLWNTLTKVCLTSAFTEDIKLIVEQQSNNILPESKFSDTVDDDFLSDNIETDTPFAAYFEEKTFEPTPNNKKITISNIYYQPEIVKLIQKKWLHLYALWGFPILRLCGMFYHTNAKVESYFRFIFIFTNNLNMLHIF